MSLSANTGEFFTQISICTGILLSSLAGLPYVHSGHPAWHGLSWWRFMLLFPAGPALIQVIWDCCPGQPSSAKAVSDPPAWAGKAHLSLPRGYIVIE